MYIAFLLSIGILIGAGFVLALQWVMKRTKPVTPGQYQLRDWKADGRYRVPESQAMQRLRDEIEVHEFKRIARADR